MLQVSIGIGPIGSHWLQATEEVSDQKGCVMALAEHYDHWAGEHLADPYRFYRRLRDEEPVSWSSKYGGFHLISRYEDVVFAAENTSLFTSTGGPGIPPAPMVGMIPIDIDPPEHRLYRTIINPAFTASVIAPHEQRIRELSATLIDQVTGVPRFDAAADLAFKLPQLVTLDFIGFPLEEHASMVRAIDDLTHQRGAQTARMAEAGAEIVQTATAMIGERRSDPARGQREDLLDCMLGGTFDGRPLNDLEMIQMIFVLLFGAVGTTASAIAGSLHYLATHPDTQEELRGRRPIPNVTVEELIRWVSPVQGLGRTVTEDLELRGCPLRKGDRVLLLWGAANHDERIFESPEEVRPVRRPNRHLGFGAGPHRCIGAHLAKLMVRVTLEEFLSRVGPFTVVEGSELEWAGGEGRTLRHLPLARTGTTG